jgi:hypothetical protein
MAFSAALVNGAQRMKEPKSGWIIAKHIAKKEHW